MLAMNGTKDSRPTVENSLIEAGTRCALTARFCPGLLTGMLLLPVFYSS